MWWRGERRDRGMMAIVGEQHFPMIAVVRERLLEIPDGGMPGDHIWTRAWSVDTPPQVVSEASEVKAKWQ
jgi:hypothetical protein